MAPMPGPVPVMTTVPFSSVVPWLRNEMILGIVNIISLHVSKASHVSFTDLVFESCTTLPL